MHSTYYAANTVTTVCPTQPSLEITVGGEAISVPYSPGFTLLEHHKYLLNERSEGKRGREEPQGWRRGKALSVLHGPY